MTLHQLPAAHPSESYKSSREFSGLEYGYVHGPVTLQPSQTGTLQEQGTLPPGIPARTKLPPRSGDSRYKKADLK